MGSKLILIDTGILAAFVNSKDINHTKSIDILNDIRSGKYGTPIITDYILNEVVTLILVRTKNHKLAIRIGKFIIHEKLGKFIKLSSTVVNNTWECFKRYSEIGLSFTDCSLIEIGKHMECSNLATFDSGFQGLMNVIG